MFMSNGYNSREIAELLEPEGFRLVRRDEVDDTYIDIVPEEITGRRVVCLGKFPAGVIVGNGKRFYGILPWLGEPDKKEEAGKASKILRQNHQVSTSKPVEELELYV